MSRVAGVSLPKLGSRLRRASIPRRGKQFAQDIRERFQRLSLARRARQIASRVKRASIPRRARELAAHVQRGVQRVYSGIRKLSIPRRVQQGLHRVKSAANRLSVPRRVNYAASRAKSAVKRLSVARRAKSVARRVGAFTWSKVPVAFRSTTQAFADGLVQLLTALNPLIQLSGTHIVPLIVALAKFFLRNPTLLQLLISAASTLASAGLRSGGDAHLIANSFQWLARQPAVLIGALAKWIASKLVYVTIRVNQVMFRRWLASGKWLDYAHPYFPALSKPIMLQLASPVIHYLQNGRFILM